MNSIKLMIISLLFCTQPAEAATATFNWNPNPPIEMVKLYTLYWNNYSGNTKKFDFKNRVVVDGAQTTVTVTDLSLFESLYFRLTATNEAGESAYSDKAIWNFVNAPANLRIP
jgi:hypothetical protein